MDLLSSAVKKENLLTADDNGLTRIHADEDKKDMNNSEEAGTLDR